MSIIRNHHPLLPISCILRIVKDKKTRKLTIEITPIIEGDVFSMTTEIIKSKITYRTYFFLFNLVEKN